MKKKAVNKTKEDFLRDVSEATVAILTGTSERVIKHGFERLICNVKTTCVSALDESWGDNGVSYEVMRCAVPTKMMLSFKARLQGTAMWDRFAEECYLRLFYALYKDVMPASSAHETDFKNEMIAECSDARAVKAGIEVAIAAVEKQKAINRARAIKSQTKMKSLLQKLSGP